jgi:hypothetical protein
LRDKNVAIARNGFSVRMLVILRNNLEDLGVDGRIILKCILKN